jgi:monoamine oxidase
MAVTRRQFLRRVGVAGGAGAMYGTMGALGLAPPAGAATPAFTPPAASDFTLTGRARRRVLVLGAGIAGLTTAYELGKAGYDITVLEARERPGGRNWTVRGGTTSTELDGRRQRAGFSRGQYLNAGPARLPQHHVTMDYCRELGVPLEVFTNSNAQAWIYDSVSGTRVRWREAKADTFGYVSELLAKATDRGALDRELTAEDQERLIAFLQAFGAVGGRAEGFAYAGSGRRGYATPPGAGLEEGTYDAPPDVAEVLSRGAGRYFSFELGWDQAMLMFQPVGGMDRIAYAFEAAVRARSTIRYGAEVRSVRNTPDGVEVTYDEGGTTRRATADLCVCAVPPHIAARFRTNLPQDVRTALSAAVPQSTGKIGLEYRRRWWEDDEDVYGGITNTDLDISTIWYPSYGYHGGRGTVVGYYNFGANAEAYAGLPHRARLEKALAQGRKVHGAAYARDLAASFSVAWSKVPHSEGGWVGWADQRGPDYRRLLRPAGGVYFAGDHLSHYIAWQAGAILSARDVVTALHSRVMGAPA